MNTGNAEDVPLSEIPWQSDAIDAPDHKASRKPLSALISGTKGNESRTSRGSTKKAATIPRRKNQFVEPLTQMYVGVGMVLMPFDSVCATAVLESAKTCAEALDDLAYQNDAVRRAIFALTQTSATTAVIVAHMPILLAVAMHHVPTAQKYAGAFGQRSAAESSETGAGT